MIRLNLAEHNRTWFDMTESQSASILQIYQNNPQTAIEARSILALTKNREFERYPFDVQTARSMSVSSNEAATPVNAISGFKVYPNPSSDYAKVEIKLDEETVSVELIIYNVLGAEVLRQTVFDKELLTINTRDFNNGIYLFVLKTEGDIVEKQKVIVAK